jgi:uncharacterized membrane protein (DUF485 family)
VSENKVPATTQKDVYLFLGITWVCFCLPALLINPLQEIAWYERYTEFMYVFISSIPKTVALSKCPSFTKSYLALIWMVASLVFVIMGCIGKCDEICKWLKLKKTRHFHILAIIFFLLYFATSYETLTTTSSKYICKGFVLLGGGIIIGCLTGGGFLLLTIYVRTLRKYYQTEDCIRENSE